MSRSYEIEVKFNNFKSHYSQEGVKFKASKPITVIAGPNGEGKSNLIEALLLGVGNHINSSSKLKKGSSFNEEVLINKSPEIKTTYSEILFDDLVKKGLHSKKSVISYPERFSPKDVVSFNKKVSNISTVVNRKLNGLSRQLIKSDLKISKFRYSTKIRKNEIDHLDLIYLNNDMSITDLFVKYVAQTYTEEINSIQGTRGKTEYYDSILNYFPEEGRIIRDVDNGKFEEKYMKQRFITSSLPTGAKKECLLYIMGMLSKKHQNKKDWMSVILVDEIESGLHITRKKKLVDALINACKKDEYVKNHMRLILTTHSPIIYSELNKHPELVDTHYVLREPNKSSIIHKTDQIFEGNGLVEKKILSELGLNVYDIPNQILFVEGPTDKLFFNQVFDQVYIQPFYTCNINKVLQDFISSFPITRSKEYLSLVDKNGLKSLNEDVEKLISNDELGISFKTDEIGFNSLEEFIYGIDVSSGGKDSTIWNKIEKKEKEWSKLLPDELSGKLNARLARRKLERKGRDGIRSYFERNIKRNKNLRELYTFVGENYKDMLEQSERDKITKLSNKWKLKIKK